MKLWTTVAVAALVAAGPAFADGLTVGVMAGKHNDFERFGANLRLSPMWERDWGGWHAGLHPEFELTHFRHGNGDGPNELDEAGALGLLRVTYGDGGLRPYGEIGLGGALLSRTRLGPKELSTSFQFTERIGLGLEFGRRFSAGWRYSHYSNADIAKPNAGLDVHEVVLGLKF